MEKSKLEKFIEMGLKFFTEKENEAKVEVFAGVKVKDSDVLVDYSELKEGADVSISTASGSEPATDGDYQLVNGVEFDVKDGKIDSIKSMGDAEDASDNSKDEAAEGEDMAKPVEGSPEEEATESPDEEKAEDSQEDQAMQALSDRVSQLEEAVKAIMDAVQAAPSKEAMSAFEAEFSAVKDSLIALSKVPTQLSADNRVEMKESELDKYSRIAEAFKK